MPYVFNQCKHALKCHHIRTDQLHEQIRLYNYSFVLLVFVLFSGIGFFIIPFKWIDIKNESCVVCFQVINYVAWLSCSALWDKHIFSTGDRTPNAKSLHSNQSLLNVETGCTNERSFVDENISTISTTSADDKAKTVESEVHTESEAQPSERCSESENLEYDPDFDAKSDVDSIPVEDKTDLDACETSCDADDAHSLIASTKDVAHYAKQNDNEDNSPEDEDKSPENGVLFTKSEWVLRKQFYHLNRCILKSVFDDKQFDLNFTFHVSLRA